MIIFVLFTVAFFYTVQVEAQSAEGPPATGAEEANWYIGDIKHTKLGGNLKQISAKGDHVWGMTRWGQVVQLKGDQWVYRKDRNVKHIGAQSGGTGIAIDAQNQGRLEWWDPNKNVWNEWMNSYAYNVNGDEGLIAGGDGCVWYQGGDWRAPNSGWIKVAPVDDCNNYQVASGADKDRWKIDFNSNLAHYVGGSWQQQTLPVGMSNPAYVDVQNAKRVVVTDDSANVWFYDGSSWGRIIKHCVQATINTKAVYCIDQYGGVHQLVF